MELTVDNELLPSLQPRNISQNWVEGPANNLGVVVACRRRELQHARRHVAVQRDLNAW